MSACPKCKAETTWIEDSYNETDSLIYVRGHYECPRCGWPNEIHEIKMIMKN